MTLPNPWLLPVMSALMFLSFMDGGEVTTKRSA